MKQKKPYSFITFLNVEDAKHSLENVNGRELKSPEELSRPGVKFHISYLEIGECEMTLVWPQGTLSQLIYQHWYSS